jgi:hypothetical protein
VTVSDRPPAWALVAALVLGALSVAVIPLKPAPPPEPARLDTHCIKGRLFVSFPHGDGLGLAIVLARPGSGLVMAECGGGVPEDVMAARREVVWLLEDHIARADEGDAP